MMVYSGGVRSAPGIHPIELNRKNGKTIIDYFGEEPVKTLRKMKLILGIAAIFFISSACGLIDVATWKATPSPAASHEAPTQAAASPTPVDTQAASPTQAPTQSSSDQPTASPYNGFVVFNQTQEEFQVYSLQGELQSRIAAKGYQSFSHEKVDVVGSNIYYFSSLDKKIFQANTSGLQVLSFQPPTEPYGFKISQDEKQIAWSAIDWNSTPIVSELWIANLDGSNAKQIARITSDESPAFLFIPLEWTADGKILFNRTITGFGGYILYGGSNSLYSYDPASQEMLTYVPAEEMHGLCLDSYRVDLNLAAFNCTSSGPGITLRNLTNQAEKTIAPVADYPIAGSVRFSPSGAWLAFGAAKGNPEGEAGKLMVLPADLSADPAAIASVERGFYYVHTWLDENTLLVTRNIGLDTSTSVVFRIQRDGSGAQDLVEGWFVDMLP
jgi:hypothetical protein